jgi:hypothetical protein
MNNKLFLDIGFYNQFECSIRINTTEANDASKKINLLILSSYTIRQLINLQKYGILLAKLLSIIKSPVESYYYYSNLILRKPIEDLALLVPLMGALGVNIEKLVPLMTPLRLMKRQSNTSEKDIVKQFWPNLPKVKELKDSKIQKSFHGELEFENENTFLSLSHSGFGILGKGINYYAPVSVTLLISYLENLYDDDYLFSKRLANVVNKCGSSFLNNEITTTNQTTLPNLIIEATENEIK